MLTTVELLLMKEYANGEDIIYLNINDREFVFRTLGVGEYISIKKCVDNEKDLEDGVCQTTVLYPDKDSIAFGTYPLAGVSSIACKEIINHSGLNNLSKIRERILEKKEEMNIFHNQCMNLVKAAFPEIPYDEIKDYSWCKLADIVVRAEQIMAIRGSTFRLIDVNENENENSYKEDDNEKENVPITTRDYLENGIEPMLYFADEIINENSKEILENPFIGGIHWNREDVIDAISKQL